MSEYGPINSPASNPDAIARRTGGSPDDPHGGQEVVPSNRPDPDPISELATFDPNSQDNSPDRSKFASQPGPKRGFGPDEFTPSQL